MSLLIKIQEIQVKKKNVAPKFKKQFNVEAVNSKMHSNHRDAGTLCVKSYRVKKKKIYILIFLGGNKLSYLLHEWFPQFDANLWRQLQPV